MHRASALALASAVILSAGALARFSGLRADPQLSPEECRQLYLRELDISMKDPLHPQRAALEKARRELLTESVVKAQVEACRKTVSREAYSCALKAGSLAEMMTCRAKPPEKKPETKDPVDPGKTSTDPKETTIQPLDVKVEAAACTRTYAHLLSVYETSEVLKKRPDREKLLTHWRSKTAVDSFQNRCMTTFRPQDLGCILSTRDPDVIQGCLLVAPETKK